MLIVVINSNVKFLAHRTPRLDYIWNWASQDISKANEVIYGLLSSASTSL